MFFVARADRRKDATEERARCVRDGAWGGPSDGASWRRLGRKAHRPEVFFFRISGDRADRKTLNWDISRTPGGTRLPR